MSLQMPCFRGACNETSCGSSWRSLVSRSCKVRSSSSRSFYDDLVRFSSGSWHGDLALKVCLSQVLVRRSCGDPREMLSNDLVQVFVRSRGPAEILSVSFHDLVKVVVRRPCAISVEILLERSLR